LATTPGVNTIFTGGNYQSQGFFMTANKFMFCTGIENSYLLSGWKGARQKEWMRWKRLSLQDVENGFQAGKGNGH
jgi:hypothetical protein